MKCDGADGGRQLTEGGPEAKPLGSTRVLQRSQPSVNMDNMENLFNPSLAAALKKLDPEDGEQIMEYFKTHALLSREKALLQASVREQKKLLVENAKLKKDIDQLRGQLQDKQKRRSAKALFSQAPPPHRVSPAHSTPDPTSPSGPAAAVPSCCPPPSVSSARPVSDPLSLGAESRIDASRLDLRVGRILSVRRHPLAEAMSVQDVDVGENSPRTVVSKLGWLQDLDQLPGSLGVFLCNVKASKMRGVASHGRLLCCCASDVITELLAPPSGSAPGDRITFLSYPGEPDGELSSKQRIWELLLPDLQVDSKGVANYKGSGFEVKGKGLCRAPSLTNCTIR
ncbi:aminoacyl tRNA synthase complex-interacting multifunctional protein 1-like isoform X2 [Xiphophorus couchianus]|uniref:aminoacyl tRNA synthase complex-interacting multifunctional protein 1-like isoform X2 n=1 Tax=Xiphophorus couchianus TaxID=32473 RepID=UPI00101631CE|nr:aminoacyl tRNA synthase complex-interacting multifunctional protein 1-like isoform X2 [Xiphophorus couchianus]